VCLIALFVCALARCGNNSSPLSPTSSSTSSSGAAGASTPVLIGAGDIGLCGAGGSAASAAEMTAKLLDRLPGTVFTAGDNAYMSGSMDEFQNCYHPTWGRHRGRTRPVPGNHEYSSSPAAYYNYFGSSAGSSDGGFYSYAVGSWRVIALNSEIPSQPGTPQLEWLKNELATRKSTCTAVIWHRPLFSSGRNGNNPDMKDVWRTIYDANVDVVINGHDHTYERFAPQDPDGRPDPSRGIREFVVGTGGAMLYEFTHVSPNSEARGAAWGVAMFTLSDGGYQWQFIPVDGASFTDAGSGTCH
jgi:hypothetical protein